MLTGGCHCGAIRFEIQGPPFNATLCHCSDCRRAAGAPAMAWFSAATHEYRVLAGEPKMYPSSARAERSFCPDCGTTLTFRSQETPHEIDIATCSLDDPGRVAPADQVRTASCVVWWDELDRLPRFKEARGSDPA